MEEFDSHHMEIETEWIEKDDDIDDFEDEIVTQDISSEMNPGIIKVVIVINYWAVNEWP